MTSSSKIRSRAAAHPRALARSPAGTDPPLVTEQTTPRPEPLHRSLALQVPLLLVVVIALAVAVGAWSLLAIVMHSLERLEVANARPEEHTPTLQSLTRSTDAVHRYKKT